MRIDRRTVYKNFMYGFSIDAIAALYQTATQIIQDKLRAAIKSKRKRK